MMETERTKRTKEVLDELVANTPDKSEHKYTKQELWMAFDEGRASYYIDFNDFFEKTFGDDVKIPDYLQAKGTPATNREAFIKHLDMALRICQLPLTVSQVEQAVKIYNTVKEHGGQTSIEHLLR